jgi:hypothetical protein
MLSRCQAAALFKQAPKVFSRMFNQLMLGCYISQGELSRKATAIHNQMKADGSLEKGDSLGSMAQPTISNVLDGQQRPNHGQLMLWLDVIAEWCDDSPDMLEKIAKIEGAQKPRYPEEIEDDLYRLALYGTIDEIEEMYDKWKDVSLLEYLEMTRDTHYEQEELSVYPNTDEIPSLYPSTKPRRATVIDDAEIIRRIREREAHC